MKCIICKEEIPPGQLCVTITQFAICHKICADKYARQKGVSPLACPVCHGSIGIGDPVAYNNGNMYHKECFTKGESSR